MFSLDALIQDVSQRRGKLAKEADGQQLDYNEVWGAFVRYLRSCMEQKRGLHLHTLCRIGWQVERKRVGGKASYRPFFQFTEPFARACMSPEAARRNASTTASEADLCPFEDFNFSKAAIKFSSMTKDQVFTGLRALMQRLCEVIGEGREVDVAFGDIGRLISRERNPHFDFAAEIYHQEGLDAPPPAAVIDEPAVQRTGAAAFRRDTSEDAMGLGIRGSAAPAAGAAAALDMPGDYAAQDATRARRAPRSPPQVQRPLTPPQEEDEAASQYYGSAAGGQYDGGMPASDYAARGSGGGGTPSRRSLASSGSAPALSSHVGAGATPSQVALATQQLKREHAYKEAMDRHICTMEARATEAMQERGAWSQHISECVRQEYDEVQDKRQRNQMNLHFLEHQIQLGEEKKREQRKDDIVAASAHDFPNFQEAEASEHRQYMLGQQARMRADLDEQVKTNATLRNLAKQRDRALEINALETNRQEMAMLRKAEREKKAYDRESLSTAWNSEIRMKNIWKAIDCHNKVASHTPQVVLAESLPPPSRGGSSTVSAGRMMTGSQRRMPLGASSSLGQLEGRLSTAGSRR